ncbi:MAG TPA: lysylphosphatidylglycerol synthase transmembrane domain-containing protein [Vicinamibacterales bacterium]|nr:lysylphosphatidylglycerol synthase transmembrane domain-containing protein [Vicinamibacterales bacterium]
MTHVPPGPDAPGVNDTTDAIDAKDPPARGGRQALIWSIKIVVSTGLLYLLLSRVDLSRLWAIARTASVTWLVVALGLYFVMVFISAWRWGVLLHAQNVAVGLGPLLRSYLVATFFNNFLPSNIGGDVIRVRDTARAAGSKTRAATVVLVDRGIGLLALVLIAAVGASMTTTASPVIAALGPGLLWLAFGVGTLVGAIVLLRPNAIGKALAPLKALHQEWVEERISRLVSALARFRESPSALALGFSGGIVVQAVLVLFYAAIAQAILVPIPLAHLAVLIPLSFIVQMAPVSVNGLGVREATFSFYFARLGLPLESALALSFLGAALVMLFSLSGGVANLTQHQRPADSGQRTIS